MKRIRALWESNSPVFLKEFVHSEKATHLYSNPSSICPVKPFFRAKSSETEPMEA